MKHYYNFLLLTLLYALFTSELIKDLSGVNQNWHYYQTGFLILVYINPVFLLPSEHRLNYFVNVLLYSLTYPFTFNTTLNIFRGLPINHLGKYDFLSFELTLLLFALGWCSIILKLIFIKTIENDKKDNSYLWN